jgi:hypothetical protein
MSTKSLFLLFAAVCCEFSLPAVRAADYPIQPIAFTEVEVGPGFWRPRMDTNTRVTISYCFSLCEETGRISNFVAAAQRDPDGFRGICYDDSDVYKIVEGAAYSLALRPDPKLDQYLDDLIAKFAAAQEPDGYLYTIKSSGSKLPHGPGPRWAELGGSHELYNVGHLYEAAVAHYQATGKRSLLDIAIRSADLICREFGPAADQRQDVPGHQEVEIGLVRLYRVTGEEKYLRQAEFFVDLRGRRELRAKLYGEYAQDHLPVVEQTEAVGHAVRGGYYYAAVADVAALTGRREYIQAIDRIWEDVIQRKLYLTGSVGQHGAGEGYAGPYKLSNRQAYNETCASIALALWNHRMFLLHGEAKYIDVLERTLYNGLISGVSLTGDRFFYPNPLECDMRFRFNQGSFERSEWFGTSCCPSNIARFIPSLAGYVYATRGDRDVYVNLYVAGTANVECGEAKIELTQQTDYPWSGNVRLDVRSDRPQRLALRLRIPGWARGEVLPGELYRFQDAGQWNGVLRVNGQPVTPKMEAGYAVLDRQWQTGDRVELALPMPVRRVLASELVEPDRGRVALQRGPLVYCVEGADHDGKVLDLWIPDDAVFQLEHRSNLLGGVTVLQGDGQIAFRGEDGEVHSRPRRVTMIPYDAWCHRGPNEMAVWLPRSQDLAQAPPRPTLASTSNVSVSHCWHLDTATAINDRIEPKNSIDHEIPRLTWWDHRGGTEWAQYEFPALAQVDHTAVYWFDDTGRGQCRTPKTWSLWYRDGEAWKKVQPLGSYEVQRDQYNELRFQAVTTNTLRIEVELQEDFSAGILEWTVGNGPAALSQD